MDPERLPTALSVAFALLVLVAGAVLAGLPAAVPGLGAVVVAAATVLAPIAAAIPISRPTGETLLLVGLPAALALATAARALVAPTPADVALAAFAVPCLLAAGATIAVRTLGDPGVSLGGVITFGAGVVLALIVCVDAALTLALRPGDPSGG